RPEGVKFSANFIITDGRQLVASRFAYQTPAPSLYWLRDDPNFPDAVMIASEPLFAGDWNKCPEESIITVGESLDINIHQI
ncbi:MAG: class II glutamine amidotransferase, partial [Chroococcales cyanobacterium]